MTDKEWNDLLKRNYNHPWFVWQRKIQEEIFEFKPREEVVIDVEKVREELGMLEGCPLKIDTFCKNPKCDKPRTIVFDGIAHKLCEYCNADAYGKVYPKKRETPKEVKKVELSGDSKLDSTIDFVLQNNDKVVKQYRAGKKQSIGFLVGAVLKQYKANPTEVKLLLERKLDEED